MIDGINNILAPFPIIPVIVLNDVEHAVPFVPLVHTLVEGGIKIIEITLRTPIALAAIKAIKKNLPKCIVGAGTIVKPSQLSKIKEANADFSVSPSISNELIRAGQKEDISYLASVATPSDLLLAIQDNFSFVKFFPAALNGGAKALRNFMSIFRIMRFCPTGGINLNNIMEYFSLKNVVCIGGSWLTPQNLIEGQQWKAISELADKAIKEIKNKEKK
ncbi:2-dehydro-3-deoxyphosphogluconate aldolase [Coxiella-like endosymbiont of Rhipicephalus sanguineus]|uniref:bifunctional 4-hydroxy-2-oxoglutarate aldolase/2-dehydro-3-deoxy-phosphogluconate aldolase n=1 Tax=Coxiella-like endosymbiont of Rhipicephalus sanguineus TaxID=1955402 RepID=UPI002040916F|nr:bifunctional 4-hydroxy-2-oxoglutarate aldolase/2-dehydro-3-deoxy-phosphogluconate aldolase [Coxiella-like endosymbiont of Rhipicephalus sanguineus]MBT8506754.1 2-dehydro-3-deoxyphosphogluconate aldolase [Coxiella-like endosymbiont of Rhipicephalus sanguineus]